MNTREATAEELRIADRFCAMVINNRGTVTRALAAGGAAAAAQEWINARGIPFPGVVFSPGEREDFEALARRATTLENYVSALQSRRYFFRCNDSLTDLDILAPLGTGDENPPEYFQGLGIVPLIIVVAGIVLVSAAISVAVSFYSDARGKEANKIKRVSELDHWAAKQGGQIAKDWAAFKNQNKAANPSFWDSLSGAFGSAIPFLLIAGLVLFMLAKSGNK